MRRSMLRVLVPLAAATLIAAGCSSSDDDDSASEPTLGGDGAPATAAPTPTGGAPATDGSTGPTTAGEVQTGDSLLDSVKANGTVRCGTRDALPGFATLDESGEHVGFDADFCRVIAAAVLGDATAVDFVDLETAARFTALQSNEIDVLVRNTTWTASRDGIEGATFLHPTYYDGQQLMVATDAGFAGPEDLDGVAVCVAAGTTSEGNLATYLTGLGVTPSEILSLESIEDIQAAFTEGRCEAWSSDGSQLAGVRSTWPDGPEALTVFPDVFSKEPLAPAVADGDTTWAQAVDWAVYATIQAEEFGITSENVDAMLAGDDPQIVQFLGGENADGVSLDTGLGLPADFAYQVVSQVGNYAEIFEANLTQLGLERGINALWTDGGLQYAPPYR